MPLSSEFLSDLVRGGIIRKETADALSIRQRPGTSQDGAIRRGGDVPSSGPSFPSGHVIPVRSKIDRYGLTRAIGPDHFFPTIREAMEAFRRTTGAGWQPPPVTADN